MNVKIGFIVLPRTSELDTHVSNKTWGLSEHWWALDGSQSGQWNFSARPPSSCSGRGASHGNGSFHFSVTNTNRNMERQFSQTARCWGCRSWILKAEKFVIWTEKKRNILIFNFFLHVRGRETQMERWRKLQSVVHSLNTVNSQSWIVLSSGARNSSWISHAGGGDPSTWTCYLPGCALAGSQSGAGTSAQTLGIWGS